MSGSRHVFQAQLFLTEAPVFGIAGTKRKMVQGVSSASVVSEPDIVSLVSQDKGWNPNGRVIRSPEVHITLHSVHHEDSWLLGTCLLSSLSWNTIDLRNIAIFRNHCVRLRCVTILIANLNEISVCIIFSKCLASYCQQRYNLFTKLSHLKIFPFNYFIN